MNAKIKHILIWFVYMENSLKIVYMEREMSRVLFLWTVYTRGNTRASRASPTVWAAATCASDGHPVIDEVAIHRHPASCNIGASLSGQLSVLR